MSDSDWELELMNWTDLPEEITPDFVSHELDYDHPFYLSDKPEWVHLRNRKIKGRIIVSEPFLIMELNRFVPYLENDRVKFHALNMPNIKIGKIDIVGFVVGINEDVRFYEYQVDDGTGTITVYYEKKQFAKTVEIRKQIDKKYGIHAKKIDIKSLKVQECPPQLPQIRPNFEYPKDTNIKDIFILENNWSLETSNGTLGRPIKPGAYVHAIGYCTLDFLSGKRPKEEISFKHLINSKLNFLATKVDCITEHEYNKKLVSWMQTVVRRRYDENPNQSESVAKSNGFKTLAGPSKSS